MKISPEIYKSMKDDIKAVADHFKINVATADGGQTGLKTMYGLLNVVSDNRAYDDNHPGYIRGIWTRVLPYDGRDHCFYYANGCNDTHVATALRKIKQELS